MVRLCMRHALYAILNKIRFHQVIQFKDPDEEEQKIMREASDEFRRILCAHQADLQNLRQIDEWRAKYNNEGSKNERLHRHNRPLQSKRKRLKQNEPETNRPLQSKRKKLGRP